MRRATKTGLWAAAAAAAALAPAARAADIAMLVGTAAEPAQALILLGDVLNAQGYEVYERQGASRADIAAALREVAARLPEAERLILVFAGAAQSAGPRAWQLPAGFAGEGRIDAALEGVPLELLLDLAAEAPGRAAVVVADDGATTNAREGFLGLAPGVGTPEVPQGVLLIAGPSEATLAWASEGLLSGSGGVAEALDGAPEELAIFGFRSPEAAFVNAAAVEPPVARLAVEPPAARPADPPAAPPASEAETAAAAEAGLALDQAARRRMQERLTALGYATGGIDGVFGPGTRSAIAAWQQAETLPATGFVSAEQLRLLAALADARGAELAAASADERGAWEAAEAEDRPRAYRAYLRAYPEGAFADEAEARIAELRDAPEPARDDPAAAAAEEALGLPRESRALIEGQLAAVGFEVGEPDGAFDAATRRALRRFQTRQGLAVSGYVNEETVRALVAASLGLR